MADLALRSVTKRFGAVVAVDDFSLDVIDGELITLLGSSGSGKTTLLRLIGGYIDPTAGSIHLGGRRVDALPPEQRNIGMVFQHYALFPHMTVARNVAFGLERRHLGRAEVERRVAEVLERVQLASMGDRYPRQLSGGQQQRVALARALAIQPALLLLDEPMSNLDASLRRDVRREVADLQRAFGVTTVLVTHDQEDALALSDRIAVLSHGRLQQIGRPQDVYDRPANRFVAEFVGRVTLWPARRAREIANGLAEYEGGGIRLVAPAGPESALVGVRPGAVTVGGATAGIPNTFEAVVEERTFQGEHDELVVSIGAGLRLTCRAAAGTVPAAPGQRIAIGWAPERTIVIAPDKPAP